jgi:nitric oxide reductase large subunit
VAASWLFLAFALSAIFITLRTGSRTGLLCLLAAGVFLLPKYGAKHKTALITIAAASFLFMGSIGAMNIERYKSIGHSISGFLGGIRRRPKILRK